MSKKTIITLTFDGVYQETVEFLLPVLERYKIAATFFVVTGTIGKTLEGRKACTKETLKTIQLAGHEIGSHSVEHGLVKTSLRTELSQRARHTRQTHSMKELMKKLTYTRVKKILKDISQKQQRAISTETFEHEARLSKQTLEELLTENIVSFAYPGGKVTDESILLLQAVGYESARGTTSALNDLNNLQRHNLNSFMWTYQTTHKHIEQLLTSSTNAPWLIETFHAISADGGTHEDRYTISQSAFLQHIDLLHSDPNIMFKTQKDVIQLYGNAHP